MGKMNEIVAVLTRELQAGKPPVGSKFPSECDLAERFRINKTTAGKALAALVAAGFLARAASRRGGTIVKSAAPFAAGKIGFITGSLTSPFFATIVLGALKAAERRRYLMSVFCPGVADLHRCVENMKDAGFAGILSASGGEIPAHGLPIVYIDNEAMAARDGRLHVLSDGYAGGKMIAELLLRKKLRDFVYFRIRYEADTNQLRYQGVMDLMTARGITGADKRLVEARSASRPGVAEAWQRLRRDYPDCRAIVCDNDYDLVALFKAARTQGVNLFAEYFVAGFGKVEAAQWLAPFVTVDQHPYDLGVRACEKLVDFVEHPNKEVPDRELLPVELVVPPRG
jgi:DNA-binding LacI/PurR family transcriptional regulator